MYNDVSIIGIGWVYGMLLNQCDECNVVGNKVFATTLNGDISGITIRKQRGSEH